MTREAQRAEDEQRLRDEAAPIELHTLIAEGMSVAQVDWEGNTVGLERPGRDHLVTAASELLKKVLLDLRSVDVTVAEDFGNTFLFDSYDVPLEESGKKIINFHTKAHSFSCLQNIPNRTQLLGQQYLPDIISPRIVDERGNDDYWRETPRCGSAEGVKEQDDNRARSSCGSVGHRGCPNAWLRSP